MTTNAQDDFKPWPQPPISTLGVIAIAFGIGVLGAYMLDLHAHTCECGYRWRHFGAFNLGDSVAHTCRRCGVVQWWKDGWHDGAFQTSPRAAPVMQELREACRRALPSETAGYPPRNWPAMKENT